MTLLAVHLIRICLRRPWRRVLLLTKIRTITWWALSEGLYRKLAWWGWGVPKWGCRERTTSSHKLLLTPELLLLSLYSRGSRFDKRIFNRSCHIWRKHWSCIYRSRNWLLPSLQHLFHFSPSAIVDQYVCLHKCRV